jgi:hypothetical protein
MAEIKSLYGSNNQPITVTINSLANNGARASTAVSNTTNLFLDAVVQCIIVSGATGTSTAGVVNVYAYGTADGGTTYSNNATGTDAAITLTVPPNVRLIGMINVVANSITYEAHPMSVASAFGGILPDNWGIIIENKSGGTLAAAGNTAFYQGIKTQSV